MNVQNMRVLVESQVQTAALANGMYLDSFTQPELLHHDVDFVVCLGGDGLILHVSTLFKTAVPPVLSFNLGSLGFLTPFDYANFDDEIQELLEGSCLLSLRMRLTCTILRAGVASKEFEVLNEVVIDRGSSPYLSNLDCFCDDKYITTVQADGIIMSTPTGSTAYSMSAGGSMVHPSVPAILFTPICPHSLSFRPIVFPDAAKLRIDIAEDARSHAWASFDGKFRQQLRRGDGLIVQMSLYPVPTVNKTDHTGDWFQSLDRAFNFNSRAMQKGFNTAPMTSLKEPPKDAVGVRANSGNGSHEGHKSISSTPGASTAAGSVGSTISSSSDEEAAVGRGEAELEKEDHSHST
jgi:NAD+ kinase